MSTKKLLISLPDELASRFRKAIPSRERSAVICKLIQKEVVKREEQLYLCARAVEKDEVLNKEMQQWHDTTLNDGMNSDEAR